MIVVIFSILRRLLIGMIPDFIDLVTKGWDHVKWQNLMSEFGGKNNWDKVRLVGNFLAPVFLLFIGMLVVEALLYFELITPETANAIMGFLNPTGGAGN